MKNIKLIILCLIIFCFTMSVSAAPSTSVSRGSCSVQHAAIERQNPYITFFKGTCTAGSVLNINTGASVYYGFGTDDPRTTVISVGASTHKWYDWGVYTDAPMNDYYLFSGLDYGTILDKYSYYDFNNALNNSDLDIDLLGQGAFTNFAYYNGHSSPDVGFRLKFKNDSRFAFYVRVDTISGDATSVILQGQSNALNELIGEKLDAVISDADANQRDDNQNARNIISNQNSNANAIIDNQNANQHDTNERLENIDDTINNDNVDDAETQSTSFFSNFQSNDHGLSGIVTAPLSLIQSITSASCSPLSVPLPFVEDNLTLPCMYSLYQNYFGDFLTLYQTITFGIVAYWVCVNIFAMVKGFKDPDSDRIEVMDL